jgi:hypothetical protein
MLLPEPKGRNWLLPSRCDAALRIGDMHPSPGYTTRRWEEIAGLHLSCPRPGESALERHLLEIDVDPTMTIQIGVIGGSEATAATESTAQMVGAALASAGASSSVVAWAA